MIINEYQYAKEIIEKKELPKGVSIKKLISYIARYYYNDYKDESVLKFKTFIFQELAKYNLDSGYYRESLYNSYVENICRKIIKGEIYPKLANPIEVQITKKELDLIKSASSEKHQKLLFTLYVLAKTREQSKGWINYSLKEIFQYANINITREEKIYMMNDLKSWGFIETPTSYTKVAFKVTYYEENYDNPVVMIISSFNNIGNQYAVTVRDGWKMCECCGRLIKIKSKNDGSTKYCNKCAYQNKLDLNKQYYRNK